MPSAIQHHALLAFGIAALAVACGAEPAAPPSETQGSGSVTGTGGSGAGAGSAGTASSTDGGGGTTGQGAAGSGGAGAGSGAGVGVTFGQISTLIPGTCGGTECHTGTQELSLRNDAGLYRRLLDTAVSECGGAHLVVPGNPQGSAIIQLVNRRCTKRGMPFYMPKDCTRNPCLPASQIQTITNWIQAGAPGP